MKNRISIRKLGRIVALVFGLALFLEVACLPWVSAYAVQVEKAMVAEVDELDKEAEKAVEQFQFLAPLPMLTLLVAWEPLEGQPAKPQFAHYLPPKAEPAFIVHHSLLI